MKKTILVLVISFLCFYGKSQNQKEDFSDPQKSAWPIISNEGMLTSFKNEQYIIKSINDHGCVMDVNFPNLDKKDTFLITAYIEQITGEKNRSFGFYFKDANETPVYFIVAPNGEYAISTSYDGNYYKIDNRTESFIRSKNTLQVYKIGNKLEFYANGNILGRYEIKENTRFQFPVKEGGVFIDGGQTVAVDNYSLNIGKYSHTIRAFERSVLSLNMYYDGKYLLAGEYLWNTETGMHTKSVSNGTPSSNGKYLYNLGYSSMYVSKNMDKDNEKVVLSIDCKDQCQKIQFAMNDSIAAAMSSLKKIDYYRLADGQLVKSLKNPDKLNKPIEIIDDKLVMYYDEYTYLLSVYSLETGKQIYSIQYDIDGYSYTIQNNKFYSKLKPGDIYIYDLYKGTLLDSFKGYEQTSKSGIYYGSMMKLSADGKLLGMFGTNLCIFDMQTKKLVTEIKYGSDYITNIAFTPDNQNVWIGTNLGYVKKINIATGEPEMALNGDDCCEPFPSIE